MQNVWSQNRWNKSKSHLSATTTPNNSINFFACFVNYHKLTFSGRANFPSWNEMKFIEWKTENGNGYWKQHKQPTDKKHRRKQLAQNNLNNTLTNVLSPFQNNNVDVRNGFTFGYPQHKQKVKKKKTESKIIYSSLIHKLCFRKDRTLAAHIWASTRSHARIVKITSEKGLKRKRMF